MDNTKTDASVLPGGAFTGRETFRDWLRRAFAAAASGGWRELIVCDVDFADWPLGERAQIENLTHWALAHGRLTLFANDYGKIYSDSPLFVRWRRQWSHQIECRALIELERSDVPSFLWSPAWALRRHDAIRCTGLAGSSAPMRSPLAESIRELRSRSAPAFPPDVLGL